jgi:Chaperone of endosialidase
MAQSSRTCQSQQSSSWSSLREPNPINFNDIRNRNFYPTTTDPLLSGNFIWNVGVGLNNPISVLHVRNTFLVQEWPGTEYTPPITAIEYSGSNNTWSLVTAPGGCFITGSLAPPSATTILIAKWGKVGILTKSPQYTLDVVGQISAITVLTFSDKRLKTDLMLINSPLALFQGIHGYTYTLNVDESRNEWVLAQEIENWYKSVDYQSLIAPTIEAIRALDTKTSQLEKLTQENNARLKNLSSQ